LSKNIVLCCDGTSNQFSKDRTNVIKLYSVLQQNESQVTYYHPGIGTMEPAGALTSFSRGFFKTLEMAVGWGLEYDIRDAYIFLMRTYQPGDKVYMFGFSRGAYTVRAVAALLRAYGLVRPDNESLVPYAIKMMMAIQRATSLPAGNKSQEEFEKYSKLSREFKTIMCRTDCKPWFVGVWDTVSSVGWLENPLKLPYVTNNPDIQIGRQAIAIDERRAFFRNHLWRKADPPKAAGPIDLKQVWFPGCHSDVGGGHPEAESGLAKLTLEWMIAEAKPAGLLVDDAKVDMVLGRTSADFVKPDCNAEIHESLAGFWKVAEFIPKKHFDFATGKTSRRANRSRRRTIPPGSLVHESAFLRKDNYKACLPPDAIMVKTP